MACFEWFGTWPDTWRILSDVFSDGGVTVLLDEGVFEKFEVRTFTRLTEELQEWLQHRGGDLVLAGSYTQTFPELRVYPGDAHPGKFCWRPGSEGGPFVHLQAAGTSPQGDGKPSILRTGRLLYQGSGYWVDDRLYRNPPELRRKYAQLRRILKRHLRRIETGEWVGDDAIRELREGTVVFSPYHYHPHPPAN